MLRSSVASTPVKTGNVSSVAHSTPVRSRFQSGDHELLPHAGKNPGKNPGKGPVQFDIHHFSVAMSFDDDAFFCHLISVSVVRAS